MAASRPIVCQKLTACAPMRTLLYIAHFGGKRTEGVRWACVKCRD